jgi:hypothetical protein
VNGCRAIGCDGGSSIRCQLELDRTGRAAGDDRSVALDDEVDRFTVADVPRFLQVDDVADEGGAGGCRNAGRIGELE